MQDREFTIEYGENMSNTKEILVLGASCGSLLAGKLALAGHNVHYAAAAQGLLNPSSAARTLDNGVAFIERVDLLVRNIGMQKGFQDALIDQIVDTVEFRLAQNRLREAS